MKNAILTMIVFILCLSLATSCNWVTSYLSASTNKAEATGQGQDRVSPGEDPNLYSQPIPVDTANQMIRSYLTSIGYPGNNSEIRSWAFNADTLINYLNDPERKNIKYLKLMVAHTLDYIRSGNYGKPTSNLKTGVFTLIIAGVDSTGQYVLTENDEAYDMCMPCPHKCVGEDLIEK